MRNRVVVAAFAFWTLFVWTTRIVNIWRDDALDRPEQIGRTGLALGMAVLAAAVLVALYLAMQRPVMFTVRVFVIALAGWTTGVWLLQSAVILMDDHGGVFKAVHVGLAVVSIGLALLAMRAAAREPDHRPQVPDGPAALSAPAST